MVQRGQRWRRSVWRGRKKGRPSLQRRLGGRAGWRASGGTEKGEPGDGLRPSAPAGRPCATVARGWRSRYATTGAGRKASVHAEGRVRRTREAGGQRRWGLSNAEKPPNGCARCDEHGWMAAAAGGLPEPTGHQRNRWHLLRQGRQREGGQLGLRWQLSGGGRLDVGGSSGVGGSGGAATVLPLNNVPIPPRSRGPRPPHPHGQPH